ncbi:unnamed protein product [Rhodiola kirilowii]
MAVAFASLSWLSWRGKWKSAKVANCSSSNTTRNQFKSKGNEIASSSKRIKRKWNSREARKLDMEKDVVLVPHDGGCISGSESEDSDWSVGWLEPHGPEFLSDDNDKDESNNSFAVLVPCYGRGMHNVTDIPQNKIFDRTGNFSDGLPAESMKYMEQWISSLQNN